MKPLLFASLAVVLTTGAVLGQSIINGYRVANFGQPATYDPKTPPPLALPEAYALAVRHMGAVTNRFHCIAANCTEMTNKGLTGWIFVFSNTNGTHGEVEVYFDKVVTSDWARSYPGPK